MSVLNTLFDAMDKRPRCSCCGQVIRKENPHRMCRKKCEVLRTLARLNKEGHEWVKAQRDSSIIRANEEDSTIQIDDVHALRLTWFGLLRRKACRTGLYQITDKGKAFLKGQAHVPAKIWCKEGRVLRATEETVTVHHVIGTHLDKKYWDDYPNSEENE